MLGLTPSAGAETVIYESEWLALGTARPSRTVTLRETKSEPFVEIVPSTAFRLEEPVLDQSGKVVVPAGSLFTSVKNRPGVRCEIMRREHQVRPACLADRDGDGRFDELVKVYITSELFFNAQPFGKNRSVQPVARFKKLNVRTEVPRFVVEIYFYNRAELVARNDIQVCVVRHDLKSWWGSSTSVRMCLPKELSLRDKDYPSTVSLYGGAFTVLSREENRVQLNMAYPKADYLF